MAVSIMLDFVVPTETVGNSFSVTLTSNLPITGVEVGDFVLRRADGVFTQLTTENTTITPVSGTNNYRLDISLTAAQVQSFQIRLRANRVNYAGGTAPSSALNSELFFIDSTIETDPTATITPNISKIYEGDEVEFAFVFSEAVTEFVIGDITVTGGTADSLTGSGTSYTLTVTAGAGAGTINISIAEDSVDPGNVAIDRDFTRHADTTPAAPTIIVTQSTRSASVGITAPTDTGGTDITSWEYRYAEGSTIPSNTAWIDTGNINTTIAISNLDEETGYAIETRGVNAQGSGASSGVVTFTTNALPTVAITFSDDNPDSGADFTVGFQWSETVTGFTTDDVVISVGTKGTFTAVDGDTYSLVITAPTDTNGNIVVSVSTNAVDAGNAADSETVPYGAIPISIEDIDEQFIPVGSTDYVLNIQVFGNPDNVKPGGNLEGFDHNWIAATQMLQIRAQNVTRLVLDAVWEVRLEKSGYTPNVTKIVYNVVPVAPVISDPGEQTLYKGFLFRLMNEVANAPTVVRGSGLLTGLKYDPSSTEEGESAILTEGTFPSDAVTTETSFDMAQYAENDGGSDALQIPVTIADGVYWKGSLDYTASGRLVELIIEGPDGAILPSTTQINADITGEGGALQVTRYSIDFRLRSDGGETEFRFVVTRLSGSGGLSSPYVQVSFYSNFNVGGNDYQYLGGNADPDTGVYESVTDNDNYIVAVSDSFPVRFEFSGTLSPDPPDVTVSTSEGVYTHIVELNDVIRDRSRSSRLSLSNRAYGTIYSENISLFGSSFNDDATLVFSFDIDGVEHTVEFDDFDYTEDRSDVQYFELQT